MSFCEIQHVVFEYLYCEFRICSEWVGAVVKLGCKSDNYRDMNESKCQTD